MTASRSIVERMLATALVGLFLWAIGATPAAAHISISPTSAPRGGTAALTFKVPNEKSNASTNKVEITFPPEAAFTTVKVSGDTTWTYTVEKTPAQGTTPASVSKITFSAGPNDAIAPDQFREFKISVGPLPTNMDKLYFPSLQTYSDGDVVRWIETTAGHDPTSGSPSPVLTLTGSGASGSGTHGVGIGEDAAATGGSSGANEKSSTALIAVIGAGLALLLSLGAFMRTFK